MTRRDSSLLFRFSASFPNLIKHWIILPAFTFIPDSPFINSWEQPTAVAWSLGKHTKLMYLFFYNRNIYKGIQAQGWWFFKHILNIMLSLAKLCLFDKTSTLLLPHRTKLFSDYNEAWRSVKRRIMQKTSDSSCR